MIHMLRSELRYASFKKFMSTHPIHKYCCSSICEISTNETHVFQPELRFPIGAVGLMQTEEYLLEPLAALYIIAVVGLH